MGIARAAASRAPACCRGRTVEGRAQTYNLMRGREHTVWLWLTVGGGLRVC